MAQIADIVFEVVRIFALTEDFLPAKDCDATMVSRLVEVVTAAKEQVQSGADSDRHQHDRRFWVAGVDARRAGPSGDLVFRPLLESQALLARRVRASIAGDESIRAFDLTNEIDDPNTLSREKRTAVGIDTRNRDSARSTRERQYRLAAHLPSLTAKNRLRVATTSRPLRTKTSLQRTPPTAMWPLIPLSGARAVLVCFDARAIRKLSAHTDAEFGLCTAPPGEPGQTSVDDFLGSRSRNSASEDGQRSTMKQCSSDSQLPGAVGAYAWCMATTILDYLIDLPYQPPYGSVHLDSYSR